MNPDLQSLQMFQCLHLPAEFRSVCVVSLLLFFRVSQPLFVSSFLSLFSPSLFIRHAGLFRAQPDAVRKYYTFVLIFYFFLYKMLHIKRTLVEGKHSKSNGMTSHQLPGEPLVTIRVPLGGQALRWGK